MNTDIHSNLSTNQLPVAAKEISREAVDAAKEFGSRATVAAKHATAGVADLAKDVTAATKDAAQYAADSAKDMYDAAALKAEEALAVSKEYTRQNPVPVILGAIVFGAAVGYLLMRSRRRTTFSDRYLDEPIGSVREAVLAALTPVAQRVHDGYDSARDGMGKVMNRVQGSNQGRLIDSLSQQIGRAGSNLKFW